MSKINLTVLHQKHIHADIEGQRSQVCCSPWGKESDTTERLNSNNTHLHGIEEKIHVMDNTLREKENVKKYFLKSVRNRDIKRI